MASPRPKSCRSMKSTVTATTSPSADRAPALSYLATVYNGIDLALYPFQERTGEHLIFLGRIHPDKGVHLAIEVARLSPVFNGLENTQIVVGVAWRIRDPLRRSPVRAWGRVAARPARCSSIGLRAGPERVSDQANRPNLPNRKCPLRCCRTMRRPPSDWSYAPCGTRRPC